MPETGNLELAEMLTTETSAFVITFACAFAVTLVVTPMMAYLGQRFRITAKPGGRRINEGDHRGVSKLGGVAVYVGFTVTIVLAQYLNVPRFDPNEVVRITGLLLGSTFILLVGILDDVVELSPLQLGIAQIVAAAVAITFQIFIESFNNPLTGLQTDPWPFLVTVTVSMFWLGLMMNTVNFMDGLDGLVGGVVFIACAVLFVNSAFVLEPAQTSVSLLPLAMLGAITAFLLFNFNPASIFLGGGAVYIGYVVGTLSIIGGAKMATILLVMGLPLMDLSWQIVNRILKGRNPLYGDRGHIHLRLLDMGYSQKRIVLTYYFFCACFGILTLVVASQLFKFVAFSVMLVMIGIGFVFVARSSQGESSTSS